MENFHWREENIIELLKKSRKLKTVDIINNSNMCKVTTLKYIRRLREKNIIDFEKIGPTKLWYVSGEYGGHLPDKKSELDLDPEYESKTQKRVSKLLKDFEEIMGMKANIILSSEGVALALGDFGSDVVPKR